MEFVSVIVIAVFILIIIAICAGIAFAFRKIKAMYMQNGFKAIKKLIIISVSVLLVLFLAIGLYYNISHKHWIEATGNLKESFSEINKIEFNKPTPTLNIVFYADDTIDFNIAEEIFLVFLNELDEDLLNELIKNADIYAYAPSDISVYFVSDAKKDNNVIIEFLSNGDYTDWKCVYPTDGNALYGKEYQAVLLK